MSETGGPAPPGLTDGRKIIRPLSFRSSARPVPEKSEFDWPLIILAGFVSLIALAWLRAMMQSVAYETAAELGALQAAQMKRAVIRVVLSDRGPAEVREAD